jgi:hypothetical protein
VLSDPIQADAPNAAELPLPVRLCQLDHRAFTALGAVAFRRAEADGTPVMVMALGEREAAVPLRALQRQLEIEDDSADGRMLGLIANSLDYVSGLAIGDALPSEVLTGEASWKPAPHHLWLAASRLRMALLEWLMPGAGVVGDDAAAMEQLVSDPKLRAQVQKAFEQAAHQLGLEKAEDAVAAMDELAGELAFIEALREGLLGRVQALVRRLVQANQTRGVDLQRVEMLQQVGRLTVIALRQIRSRFEEVDVQTGEVLPALRNAAQQRSFIRAHRDGLYVASRGWETILADWDRARPAMDEAFWALLAKTYHFLAPRYMPVTEWRRMNGMDMPVAADKPLAMTW